ncbi:MAG: amidohydrolase [Oscillospiraceae bacterium]|nr:amidohydrolase [Oscillospiraceae bacterium]
MYIDFHTHAFTDAIAERAVDKLEKIVIEAGFKERAETRGTVAQLLEKMDEWGVDRAVVLPIATKPSQQMSINNWAAEVMSDRLYCFGTVHPDAEDALEELERVKALGLKGIKLHPDYQGFFADEEKMFPIYEKCAELGLPLIFHAGFDVLSPDCIHCTPQMSAAVIERVPRLTLILAHLGGNELWDDVEKYLVGKNVYLDTAFIAGHISDGQLLRIIRNHGAEKILLASDCPWHPASAEIEMLKRLPLTDEEFELISWKNALGLLGDT